MYFSSLQGQGSSCSPGARGAPTECMQGTTRFSSLSISAIWGSDAGHDAHADDGRRGGVSELHA